MTDLEYEKIREELFRRRVKLEKLKSSKDSAYKTEEIEKVKQEIEEIRNKYRHLKFEELEERGNIR